VENRLQRDVANAAQQFGWHYLPGFRQMSQGHGVCQARDRWINTSLDSKFTQCDLEGTWHASATGQTHMSDIEYPMVLQAAQPRTRPEPAVGSPAVVVHDGFTSVFTVNAGTGHLQETYLDRLGNPWRSQDFTQFGTPPAVGSPAVVVHDGFTSVFTVNAGTGHLQETYLDHLGNPWRSQDLTG
jgi:hypothetical protein